MFSRCNCTHVMFTSCPWLQRFCTCVCNIRHKYDTDILEQWKQINNISHITSSYTNTSLEVCNLLSPWNCRNNQDHHHNFIYKFKMSYKRRKGCGFKGGCREHSTQWWPSHDKHDDYIIIIIIIIIINSFLKTVAASSVYTQTQNNV